MSRFTPLDRPLSLQLNCTYPVLNNLAVGARPKYCKKDAQTFTEVPYDNDDGVTMKVLNQIICVKHACEIAAWKLITRMSRPRILPVEFEILRSYFGLNGPSIRDGLEHRLVRAEHAAYLERPLVTL